MPTEELAPYPTRDLFRDLARYLKPYRGRFLAGTIIRSIGDLLVLYLPIVTAQIVTLLSRPAIDTAELTRQFTYLLLAGLTRTVCLTTAKVLVYQVANRVDLDAQRAVLVHMERLDTAWHERENSGNKIRRIERGGDSLDRILRLWVDSYIEIVVSISGIIIILSRFDHTMSILLAIYAAIFYSLSRTLTRSAAAASRIVNIKEEVFTGTMFELISNIRTVKVLGMRRGFFVRIDAAVRDFSAAVLERIARFQWRNFVLSVWVEIGRITMLAVAAIAIVNGRYDVGFFVIVWGYFGRIQESVRELSDNAQQVVIARDALGRMQSILAEPVLIDDDQGKQKMPVNWRSINLSHVSFGYSGQKVLCDINITITRGEKIGIVGLSGAGKSTLFKLLLKEYEGFTGQIAFDDVPIQTILRSDYFNHTAVVLQDTEVFNFSLRDNVTLANLKETKNEQQFQQAIDIAHVADFLPKLSQGVDTLIGEKGVKLSGGERQRLGIARAVFKQPELLFLDEATSHLDSESEAKIQDSLHQFFRNVTAIVIAHRLSTIKQMDRILVLEHGRIIEEGGFSALQKKQGRFHELWEQQKL